MNYKKFKVVGLQRSGTNWIAALISKNFVVQEDLTTTFWKHLTPMGVKNTQECSEPFYQLENFVIRPDTFYVATKKNFQLWTESIKRKPMDTHRTHIGSLDQIHDSWCGWAKDQSSQENFFYKDYLEWLDCWPEYLAQIHSITMWPRKDQQYSNVSKVYLSDKFNIEHYQRNKNEF